MNNNSAFEYNKIYNIDCDIALPIILKQGLRFDLVLTDPPYNIGKDFGNSSDKLDLQEYLALSKRRIDVCSKLLTHHGSLVWFGIHHYIGYIQAIMYELGLEYRRMIIWNYDNGFSRSVKTLATTYEPILWFSSSKTQWNYNADDIRIPYKSDRVKNPVYYKSSKGERKAWLPNPLGAMKGDIWNYPTLAGKNYSSEKTGHPTQKPESLITDLIKAFCPKNVNGYYEGKILDPFHGSGTVGVCCESLNQQGHNIQWIGLELEKKWCQVGNERISKLTSKNLNEVNKKLPL